MPESGALFGATIAVTDRWIAVGSSSYSTGVLVEFFARSSTLFPVVPYHTYSESYDATDMVIDVYSDSSVQFLAVGLPHASYTLLGDTHTDAGLIVILGDSIAPVTSWGFKAELYSPVPYDGQHFGEAVGCTLNLVDGKYYVITGQLSGMGPAFTTWTFSSTIMDGLSTWALQSSQSTPHTDTMIRMGIAAPASGMVVVPDPNYSFAPNQGGRGFWFSDPETMTDYTGAWGPDTDDGTDNWGLALAASYTGVFAVHTQTDLTSMAGVAVFDAISAEYTKVELPWTGAQVLAAQPSVSGNQGGVAVGLPGVGVAAYHHWPLNTASSTAFDPGATPCAPGMWPMTDQHLCRYPDNRARVGPVAGGMFGASADICDDRMAVLSAAETCDATVGVIHLFDYGGSGSWALNLDHTFPCNNSCSFTGPVRVSHSFVYLYCDGAETLGACPDHGEPCQFFSIPGITAADFVIDIDPDAGVGIIGGKSAGQVYFIVEQGDTVSISPALAHAGLFEYGAAVAVEGGVALVASSTDGVAVDAAIDVYTRSESAGPEDAWTLVSSTPVGSTSPIVSPKLAFDGELAVLSSSDAVNGTLHAFFVGSASGDPISVHGEIEWQASDVYNVSRPAIMSAAGDSTTKLVFFAYTDDVATSDAVRSVAYTTVSVDNAALTVMISGLIRPIGNSISSSFIYEDFAKDLHTPSKGHFLPIGNERWYATNPAVLTGEVVTVGAMQCPDGFGMSSFYTCEVCPEGSYSRQWNPTCRVAPAGWAATKGQLSTCSLVNGGYTPTPGLPSCLIAQAGYVADVYRRGEVPCDNGTIPNSYSSSCDPCPAGTTNPLDGAGHTACYDTNTTPQLTPEGSPAYTIADLGISSISSASATVTMPNGTALPTFLATTGPSAHSCQLAINVTGPLPPGVYQYELTVEGATTVQSMLVLEAIAPAGNDSTLVMEGGGFRAKTRGFACAASFNSAVLGESLYTEYAAIDDEGPYCVSSTATPASRASVLSTKTSSLSQTSFDGEGLYTVCLAVEGISIDAMDSGLALSLDGEAAPGVHLSGGQLCATLDLKTKSDAVATATADAVAQADSTSTSTFTLSASADGMTFATSMISLTADTISEPSEPADTKINGSIVIAAVIGMAVGTISTISCVLVGFCTVNVLVTALYGMSRLVMNLRSKMHTKKRAKKLRAKPQKLSEHDSLRELVTNVSRMATEQDLEAGSQGTARGTESSLLSAFVHNEDPILFDGGDEDAGINKPSDLVDDDAASDVT
ncbi:putative protein serine/threonine kinase [Carpediemonas membranifera]|uniref:Uncharacterized protein n=1 Tax=Carpediemonas membranifera TaxID=201153 RepID=A0A8J6BB47_9EUKA|nr:putative protein serine/threonine kinase [Carpediemonas membranifera]|eukprot:KAG9393672.1 putative protein serine/threonine kinase [Carpediemonas membranifera]